MLGQLHVDTRTYILTMSWDVFHLFDVSCSSPLIYLVLRHMKAKPLMFQYYLNMLLATHVVIILVATINDEIIHHNEMYVNLYEKITFFF